jgi:hypothetical protein
MPVKNGSYYKSTIKGTLLFFFLFGVNSCIGQKNSITGTVKSRNGNPIPGATVVIKDSSQKIIFYAFSNNKGLYEVMLADTQRINILRQVEVSAIGFEGVAVAFSIQKKEYDFLLDTKFQELSDVIVSGMQVVKKKGDTTSYNVEALGTRDDRSIGDVIARIPGMTVSPDGTIKFKDREIKGLYIQGDDLMEGDYGFATNVISKEMIKAIEVIERFQPVRALRNKVGTNDIGINLVLKNENNMRPTGQIIAGIGTPKLVNLLTSTMLFNKKNKMLFVSRYNSIGELSIQEDVKDILSDGVVDNPGVPDKYINRNRSFLSSANYLRNLDDTLQVKVNVQYLKDKNQLDYSYLNRNYIRGDTVNYTEKQLSYQGPFFFDAQVSIEQNKESRFVSNKLNIRYSDFSSNNTFHFNDYPFRQQLSSRQKQVSNHLHWMPRTTGRNTYTLDWAIRYGVRPQFLHITPGVDSAALNANKPYLSANQELERKSFYNEITFNYFFGGKSVWSKSVGVGISNELQDLSSGILLKQTDGSFMPYAGDKGNDLKWHKHREYLSARFFLKKQYFMANIMVPLIFQQISVDQVNYFSRKELRRFFVNPALLLNYFLNPENSLNFTYELVNIFGSIDNIYQGAVLTSFKELSSNQGDIQEVKQNKIALKYNFSRAIRLFDVSVGFTFNHKKSNSVYATEFRDNILRTSLLKYNNNLSTLKADAFLGKYLFPVKAKLETGVSYTFMYTNQIINGQALPFRNYVINVMVVAGRSFFDKATIQYNGNANWIGGAPKDKDANAKKNDKIFVYTHKYSFILKPSSSTSIAIQGKQQINYVRQFGSTRYFFLDGFFRMTAKKARLELEFRVDNVLNVRNFGIYFQSVNQFFAGDYALRGRMMTVEASFKF